MKSTIPANLQLETERFQLRLMTTNDVPQLVHYAETEPELWDFALVPSAGKENMIRYIDEALSGFEKETTYPFVVIDRVSGEIVGSTRYYDFQLGNASTLLGYTWYSKHQQGNGINAHCKFLLLQYAFETLELERVELRADTRNHRSLAAMRKIGCIEEGILRNHLPIVDGSRRDSIIFSILREEWYRSVKSKLEERIKG